MTNPPTQELLSCPFCKETDWKNVINLARHFEKEHEYKALLKLAELIAQEGKIKENLCPLCGNKTDVEIEVMEDFPYIPKERIEQRMKEIHPKASAPSSYKDIAVFKESEAWTLVYKELRDILK